MVKLLIHSLLSEGCEFMVGLPPTKFINKKVDEKLLEPYKIARVEVPEHMGAVDPRLWLRKEQVPLTPYSVHRRTNVYWSWSECLQRINRRYSSTKVFINSLEIYP
ncbi:hypothetical protein SAY86_005346 [Trapa natans]|uniref:Uncharacterized protein n=1 Tax=Trapa natans TaxID=22666 RepID=A0AAN7QVE8_TRANT|nr:hypothetical protein SAY86_005346 [Trapa natans]